MISLLEGGQVEYAEECTLCQQQYFSHETSGYGQCMDCSKCWGCDATLRLNGIPYEGAQFCSAMCYMRFYEDRKAQARCAAREQRERATHAAREPRALTGGARLEVFERDAWLCHLCGDLVDKDSQWPEPHSPVLDHVVPYSQGGKTSPENLRTAHARCNNMRVAKSLEEFHRYMRARL